MVVEPSPVGFNDQALPTPEKVDLKSLLANPKSLIATRDRQIPLREKWQQPRLHPTAKANVWIATPLLEDATKPRATAAARTGEDPINLRHVEHLQDRGLLDGSAQRGIANRAGQVDDDPGWTGAGNSFVLHRVFANGLSHVVPVDSRDLAPEFHSGDDMDGAGLALPEPQEKSSGTVGDNRA